jgi:hypothetical protein
MGLFDIFKKASPSSTARLMTDAYAQSISSGSHPKAALFMAYKAVFPRHAMLRDTSPKDYLEGVFKDEFINLSSDPKEAKEFVARAMMNIIVGFLHPEISSMRQALNLTAENFGKHGLEERQIESQIKGAL